MKEKKLVDLIIEFAEKNDFFVYVLNECDEDKEIEKITIDLKEKIITFD